MSNVSRTRSKARAWVKWFAFMESMALLLAVAGPGYRHAFGHHGDHTLFARMVMDDPGFLDAVAVNLVLVNLFFIVVLTLAWISARRKRRKEPVTD